MYQYKRSINRNIMECKAKKNRSLLWGAPSINRNIMECKVKTGRFDFSIPLPVLIETLWNVKAVRCRSVLPAGHGINRNIMECKVFITGHIINNLTLY